MRGETGVIKGATVLAVGTLCLLGIEQHMATPVTTWPLAVVGAAGLLSLGLVAAFGRR